MIWQDPCSVIEPLLNADGIYSWPFDPLLPVDVRFQIFDRRTNLRMNRHDYFELLYVLQGELEFQIHRQYFNVKAGDMLVIGSTFFHRPIKHSSPPAKAVLLYFLPDLIRGKDTSSEDAEYLMPFLAQDVGFPHLVPAKTGIPSQILNLIQRIYAELPARSTRGRLNAKTYLKMILVLLGNHYADYRVTVNTFRRKQENIERLHPLFEFLDQHFAEPITVDEAASKVHMSKSHFMRFFKNVTGQGFVTYRHHLRIVKAESLLATTDISIAELCQQVGYCDQSYFGMVFRKFAHMTPRQYRRQFCGMPAGSGPKQNRIGLQAEEDARVHGLRVLTRYMDRKPGEPGIDEMRGASWLCGG
jgi:AraC family transcriptional activator of pobA